MTITLTSALSAAQRDRLHSVPTAQVHSKFLRHCRRAADLQERMRSPRRCDDVQQLHAQLCEHDSAAMALSDELDRRGVRH